MKTSYKKKWGLFFTAILIFALFTQCKSGTDPVNSPPPPGESLLFADLIAPLDLATNQSSSIELKWKKVEGAREYIIRISESEEFAAKNLNLLASASGKTPEINENNSTKQDQITSVDTLVAKSSFTAESLPRNTTYYWKVLPVAENMTGEWSNVRQFSTGEEDTDTTVELTSPNDEEQIQVGDISFEWDPIPDSEGYHYQLGQSLDFTEVLIDSVLSSPNIEILELTESTEYYWQVAPILKSQTGAWTHGRSFTLSDEPPIPGVILQSPSKGSDTQPVSFTFTWEEISGIEDYQLQIATQTSFSKVKHDETVSDTSFKVSGLDHEQVYYWRVRARTDKRKGSWSDTWTFTTEAQKQALPKVPLLDPNNGEENQPTSLTLSWKEVSETDEYQVQVAADDSFSSITHGETVSETSFDVAGLDHEQTYYWRVRAKADDSNGAWSDHRTFTTEEAQEQDLPKVSLLDPNNGEEGQPTSLTLSWEKASGADEYQVQVAADDSFSDIAQGDTVSETSFDVDGLDHEQTYSWRVRARTDDSNGSWSDPRTFITEEAQEHDLPKVSLLDPNNGEEGQPTSLTLSWEEVSGADEYQVQVAADDSFSDITQGDMVSETSFDVTGLDHDQIYYWRVRASADNSNGAWSDTRTFTTEAQEQDIPKVSLLDPNNGEDGQPTSVTLSWEKVSGADEYQVQVASDNSFSDITHGEMVSETFFDVTGLDHDQIYYWRVRASADNSNGAWSDTRTFTTEAQEQDIPKVSLLDPNNGEENQPTSLTLSWEEVSGAEEYQAQVAADNSFSSITNGETVTETSLEVAGLDHEQTYYWRVRAGADEFNGSWSDPRQFTTKAQNIPQVTLLDPFDGTNNQPRSLTLSWEETSGAEEYQIQVAEDPSFSNEIANEMVTGTTYDLSGLDQDHIYYWRVRAGANGFNGEWSDVWEFRTEIVVTSPPPVSGEFISVRNGNFEADGQAFRFAGTNAYYLPNYQKLDPGVVDRSLDAFQDAGISVVRMWAFYDGYDCGWSQKDASENVIQTAPGQYSEQALRDLDQVIAKGKQRGIRFVMTLVNYWDELGGICQYNTWAGASDPSDNMNFFLNNSDTQKWYRDYISMLLNRVNTETGRAYKDEPAIFSWQIMNEGRNPGQAPQVLRDWYREIARYIKSIDSNHLVSTGEEGFDDTSLGQWESGGFVHPNYSSQDYSNSYVLRADRGTSYVLNTAIPEIDFGWAHWYPLNWGWRNADNSDRNKAMKAWLSDHQSIAEDRGKPFVIGEYGFPGSDWRPIEALYPEFWNHAEQIGLDGSVLWQLTTANAPKCREFGGNICWPDDTSLYNDLKNHIQTMKNN